MCWPRWRKHIGSSAFAAGSVFTDSTENMDMWVLKACFRWVLCLQGGFWVCEVEVALEMVYYSAISDDVM